MIGGWGGQGFQKSRIKNKKKWDKGEQRENSQPSKQLMKKN